MCDAGEKGQPGVIGLPYHKKAQELRAYAAILESAADYVSDHCFEVSIQAAHYEELLEGANERHRKLLKEYETLKEKYETLKEKYDILHKNYMELGNKYSELDNHIAEDRKNE